MPHVRRSMLDHDRRRHRTPCATRSSPSSDSTRRTRRLRTGPIRRHARHDTHARRGDRRATAARDRGAARSGERRRRAVLRLVRAHPGWLRRAARAPARSPPALSRRDRRTRPPPRSEAAGRSSRRCRSPPEQAGRLAALAAVALVANFCGALLSQNGDAVTDTFDRSDEALGVALAIARAGVLVSLVAIALADRLGRRRLILVALVGACVANCVTALAPTFEVFTGAQLFSRALVNTVPDRRRHRRGRGSARRRAARSRPACSRSRSAPGFALAVVLLPLADLGDYGWRISFVVSAALVLFVPVIARHLKETRRYVTRRRPQPYGAGRRARGVRPAYGHAVPAARARRVPHQRVQRAVVTAHEPLPHARARLHELRRRAVPHGHRRAARDHRRAARRAGSPRAAADGR